MVDGKDDMESIDDNLRRRQEQYEQQDQQQERHEFEREQLPDLHSRRHRYPLHLRVESPPESPRFAVVGDEAGDDGDLSNNKDEIYRAINEAGFDSLRGSYEVPGSTQDVGFQRGSGSLVYIGEVVASSIYQGIGLSTSRNRQVHDRTKLSVHQGSNKKPFTLLQLKIISSVPSEALLVHLYEVDEECNFTLRMRSSTSIEMYPDQKWEDIAETMIKTRFPRLARFPVKFINSKTRRESAGSVTKFFDSSKSLADIEETKDEEEDCLSQSAESESKTTKIGAMTSNSRSSAASSVSVGVSEPEGLPSPRQSILIYSPRGASNEIIVDLCPEAVEALSGPGDVIKSTFYCPRMERERHFVWQWTKDGLVRSPLTHNIGGIQMSSIPTPIFHTSEDSLALIPPPMAALPGRAPPLSSTFIFDLDASTTNGLIPINVLRNALLNRWKFDARLVENEILYDVQASPDSESDGVGPSLITKINTRLRNHILEGDTENIDEGTREVILALFPFACRVSLESLSGGFSGAKVYRCVNTNWDGLQEIPSVVKVDDGNSLDDEYNRMVEITPLLGENAPRILARSSHGPLSALRIELCGATWCLPGAGAYNTQIATFRKLFTSEMLRLVHTNSRVKSYVAHRRGRPFHASTTELPYYHGNGSKELPVVSPPRRMIARATSDSVTPKDFDITVPALTGGERRKVMRQRSFTSELQAGPTSSVLKHRILQRSSTISSGSNGQSAFDDYSILFGEIETVIGEVFGTILHQGATDKARIEEKSLFSDDGYPIAAAIRQNIIDRENDPVADLFIGRDARAMVKIWTGVDRMDVKEYFEQFATILQRYELDQSTKYRLMGHVHGDLNGANILIDGESIVWLIDFAFSGYRPVLTDLMKLENTILFEYTPLQTSKDRGIAIDDFIKVIRALIHTDLVELPPLTSLLSDSKSTEHLAIDQLWSVLQRLRQHVVSFCAKDPRPEYLHAGRLFYALKTLAFRDVSIEQKKLALGSALGHASRLASILAPGSLGPVRHLQVFTSFTEHNPIDARVHAYQMSLEREQVKHFTIVGSKDSAFVDPVSQNRLSVLKECVRLDICEHSLGVNEEPPTTRHKLSVREMMEYLWAVREVCENTTDCQPFKNEICPSDIPALCANQRLREDYEQLGATSSLQEVLELTLKPLVSLAVNMQYVPVAEFFRRFMFTLVYLEGINNPAGASSPNTQLLRRASLAVASELDSQLYDVLAEVSKLFPSDVRLTDVRHLVILGGPASGKSVLLRQILVRLSIAQNHRSPIALVPLRIRLIDMARLIEEHKLTENDDLIMCYLANAYGAMSMKLSYFRSILFSGRVLLLFDGFDEAGSSRSIIAAFLKRFLQQYMDVRTIVTSREIGFTEFQSDFFEAGFRGLFISALTHERVQAIVSLRVPTLKDAENKGGVSPSDHLFKEILSKEYDHLTQTPLMVSFLIHTLLSSRQTSTRRLSGAQALMMPKRVLERATGGETMLKSQLFSLAVDQMLHQGEFKYKRNRGREEKEIGRDLSLLQDPLARSIIRNVALLAHSVDTDDVELEHFGAVLVALVSQNQSTEESEKARFSQRLIKVNNALQRSIDRGLVPLFEVSIAETRNTARSQEYTFSRTVSFVHRALKEHLAAECITERLVLCYAQKNEKEFARICGLYFGVHNFVLKNTFWQDVFLSTMELLSVANKVEAEKLIQVLFVMMPETRHVQVTFEGLREIWSAIAAQGNIPALVAMLEWRSEINESYVDVESDTEHFDLIFLNDKAGNNCLHLAAEKNQLQFVEVILSRISKEDSKELRASKGVQDWSPAIVALRNNNLECYRKLYSTFGDMDIIDEDESNLPEIIKMVKLGNVAEVKQCLQRNPDAINDRGSTGMNSAMWACALNENAVLELLLKYGHPESYSSNTSKKGNTCLTFAVENNSIECVKTLLKNGVKPTQRIYNGDSMLLLATSYGNDEIVQLLIGAGAQPGEAIMVSAVQGRDEFVRRLIQLSALAWPDAVNAVVPGTGGHPDDPESGGNPLAAACVAGHKTVVTRLLELGADPNHPILVQGGTCALHVAVKKGYYDCVARLLEYGANANTIRPAREAGEQHVTALDLAEMGVLDLEDSSVDFQKCADILRHYGGKKWEDMFPDEREVNMKIRSSKPSSS